MASYDPQPAGRVPAKSPDAKSEGPRARDEDAKARKTTPPTREPKTGRTVFKDWASI